MNLLDTGMNHQHTGQPRQTHPPVATVDANVLSRFIISYLEPKRPVFWLELGPCFGEWDRFKIVDIQRFPTLPTPNLSYPTASLGGLLCGLCKSQMSRFPIYPIWLKTWLVMWMSHAWKTKAKVCKSTNKYAHLHEGKIAFRAFAWLGEFETTDSNSWYLSHATYLIRYMYRSCEVEAKRKHSETKCSTSKCTTGASKISWTCPRSYSRLVLDLAINVESNLDCVIVHFSTQVSSLYPDPPSDMAIPWNTHPVLAFTSECKLQRPSREHGLDLAWFRRGKEKST